MNSDIGDIKYKLRILTHKSAFEFVSEICFGYFNQALNNKVKPEIKVFPFEPGMGKSRGIQKFLRG
ncbi:hypothetical protein [uncultured Sphingomonas sp.]|uniref:hypothetical protein n=1 Tax=uncultured Sphingomonas sp. TaxID=158754 RepID=UPI0025EACBE0|nr:hypothetical protein [uncultured Sphingomonas sp.]